MSKDVYYLVIAQRGEYEDHHERTVAVYRDEHPAKLHVELANAMDDRLAFYGWGYAAIYDTLRKAQEDNDVKWNTEAGRAKEFGFRASLNPYDPDWDSPKTNYYYSTIEAGSERQLAETVNVSRANGSGQCQDCCFVGEVYPDGGMRAHWPFRHGYPALKKNGKGFKYSDFDKQCTGVEKPPRAGKDEDFDGWLKGKEWELKGRSY